MVKVVALGLAFGLAADASVGAEDLDRYRYRVDAGRDQSVCGHMRDVFNSKFAYPWKRPMLAIPGEKDAAYGATGPYAFPKLPDVAHDERMTLTMSYSRLPTSPEFEAIRWREGRYRLTAYTEALRPMLVAEFHIDNDGYPDTVLKISFMGSQGSNGGDQDYILVFKAGDLDLSRPVRLGLLFREETSGKLPAMLTALPGFPYRSIRPFIFDGVTYLAGYQQVWGKRNVREAMHVLRYRGVEENPDPADRRNVVRFDRICAMRMTAQRSVAMSTQGLVSR